MSETVWKPKFLYTVCQQGVEGPLKQELTSTQEGAQSGLRPAFSRPGFVTFKLNEPCEKPERFSINSTFARAWGFSLGSLSGEQLYHLAKNLWQLPGVLDFLDSPQVLTAPLKTIHVWQRDQTIPGNRGFEPGPTPLTEEIRQRIIQESPLESLPKESEGPHPAARNRWILDVILDEPGKWWVGCHLATSRLARYAGGVLPITSPPEAVSRAYLKMAEAMRWSNFPMIHGDQCLDLGCAPGGGSQALLDRGLTVTGVDPAEVDPLVLEHPHFNHLRKRCAELSHRQIRGMQWLVADINATPSYTLDAANSIITYPQSSIRGMLLTLKFTNWQLAKNLPLFIKRVRSWGYQDVRTRQLAHNRQELCLAALRNRSQRRLRRR